MRGVASDGLPPNPRSSGRHPSALGWSVFRLDWPLALHSAVIAAVVARVGALMASTIMGFDVAQLEEVGVDL